MKTAKASKSLNKTIKVNVIGIKVKNKPASITYVTEDGQQVSQETVKATSNERGGTQLVSASK